MIVKIVNTECEDYNKEFKLRRMNYDTNNRKVMV